MGLNGICSRLNFMFKGLTIDENSQLLNVNSNSTDASTFDVSRHNILQLLVCVTDYHSYQKNNNRNI